MYLREPQHTGGGSVGVDVSVTPRLHEDAPNAARVALDLSCELRPSAPWLSCATHLALTHGGKGFNLRVSPQGLPPGAHYAEVAGTDAAAPGVGALFVLPVTVLVPHADLSAPHQPPSVSFDGLAFAPGHIERRFVVPPRGATWATITLRARAAPRSSEPAGSVVFMVHATQLLPHRHIGHTSSTTRVTMGLPGGADGGAPTTEYVKSLACEGGVTMEVALAQWWMSLGETTLDLTIEFFGVVPSAAPLLLDGRELFGSLELAAPFRRTAVEPEGTLRTLRRAVRLHAATLLPPLPPCAGGPGVGDEWPKGLRIYDYVLAYKFSLKEGCDALSVRFPSLNTQLYESPYEAQLWAVFDQNKQLLRFGDYYPEPVKLKAGDYEARSPRLSAAPRRLGSPVTARP